MGPEYLAVPATILVTVTSCALLASQDGRLSCAALGVQYLGVFILTSVSWPLEMAAVKLLAGWAAVSALALSWSPPSVLEPDALDVFQNREASSPTRRWIWRLQAGRLIFRLLAAGLITLVALSAAPALLTWIPFVQPSGLWGAAILIGLGLLQLGFTTQPLPSIIGLLTVFSGFEIIYAAVEGSILVAGLLGAINLLFALVGAYLMLAPSVGEEP